ncbi:carbon-nitrogen hydrolase [Whalleya microplaca]|nr:carbon-nitrogen hydrolase [Whalleya microplaca]
MAQPLRVAACHASPVFLSARKTTDKAISLINQASANGANLVVFPETYIAAFPIWSAMRAPTENHDLFARMAAESVYVDGDEIGAIRQAARAARTIVSLGFSKKTRHSSACLYNSNLIIDADGEVLVHHRKLMPTFYEKLTWSPGDGHGLRVANTRVGKIGALICGENTNPLARYTMMAQGEQVHISSWPAIWPTRLPRTGSAAAGAGEKSGEQAGERGTDPSPSSVRRAANFNNVAANRTRAAAHCFEAKCFGVMCAGFLGADAVDAVAEGSSRPEETAQILRLMPNGATMFLDPTGSLLPGFIVNPQTGTYETVDFLQKDEGIIYADMNLEDCIEGKQYHDVVGGYQRFDVFDLKVNRTRQNPVTFVGDQQYLEVQSQRAVGVRSEDIFEPKQDGDGVWTM